MSDTWNTGMLFGSGLLPTSQSARDVRQRIALAMLMKKGAIPKNLGEGIFSAGDSIGDALMARTQVRQAEEQSKATDAAIEKLPAPAPGKQAATDIVGADDQVAAAPAPPPLAQTASAVAAPPPPQQAPGAPQSPQAGYRPPPTYLASSLERLIPDPERRGYLGHLASREARNPNEVSSTGAAGPFQFTRGTGAQYGIPGNARFDVDKSIVAANQLTDDNAAVLEKALGRPPSPGELALAHQQGAGTAAKMLAGSGNAPAYNLAVNNAGGLGPQAAAQKIMGYYGMPGTGSPRDNAAAILASRPPGPSDAAQEATFSDVMGSRGPQPAFAPTASAGRAGDIQSDLPPVTGAVSGPMGQSVGDTVQQRQETLRPPQGAIPTPPPGPQVAQAPQPNVFPPVSSDAPKAIIPGGGFPTTMPSPIPAAPPDPRSAIRSVPDEYVPPEKDPQPEPPSKPGMGPIEQRMIRDYLNKDVDPRIKEAAQRQIEAERAQLAIPYENQVAKYKADIANWQKRQEQTLGYKMGLPKQRAETENQYATTEKTRAETGGAQAKSDVEQMNASFQKRTGREREPFLKEFAAEKEVVGKAVPVLRDAQIAREALDSGLVISGAGADAQIAAARIAAKIGSNDEKKIAEASERYQKAIDRTVSYGIMLFNGKDPRITEGDVQLAKGNVGTPDMQEASKRKILDIMQEDMHRKVNNYEDLRETYLRGDPQHRIFKVPAPDIGTPEVRKALIDNQNRPDVIAEFNRMHGPGAAELEIARHKRRINRPDD